MNKIVFVVVFILVVLFFGRNLNPFSSTMFIFHDETQPARIQQFVLDLKNLQIPPRMTPDFSFKMGYPVFNFYAPASYWITSMFSLAGFDTINALKLSFLLSILIGFVAMYLFLKEYFDFFPSLTGAVLYVSSLYYPLDIFVRGNLGEVWFLALFPLALFFLEKNTKKPSQFLFFFSVVTLSLLFTVHNLLSIVSVFIILGYILLKSHKKIHFIAMIFAFLLSSYFIIPMLAENHLTYATSIATKTNYKDHFVCPSQLWQSQWGFGGSVKGCTDGMSFMIGKLQLLFFAFGLLTFTIRLLKRKKISNMPFYTFILFITFGSLYMTTYQSKFLWDILSPLLSIFQFPWRFIAFSLLGISFFSSYFMENLRIPFRNIFLSACIVLVLVIYSKYFAGISYAKQDYEKKFLSQEYIEKKAAYKIPEYLPRAVNYNIWRTYEKKPPEQSFVKTYAPLWKETPVEKFSNYVTLLSFSFLLYAVKRKNLWKKISA